MNEPEDRLEGLVDQVGKVILNLLCLLDVDKVKQSVAEPV